MISTRFTIFYIVVTFGEIICGETGFQLGVYLLKPLVVCSLLYLIIQIDAKNKLLFIWALLFSLAGDILLMLPQNNTTFFLLGLISFLITHTLYIYIFAGKATFKALPLLAISILVAALYVFVLHKHVPSNLQLPVIIYILILSVMGIVLNSMSTNQAGAFKATASGALLFMMSDSSIAIDKFVMDIPFSTLLIMSTYAAAQLFITKGFIATFAKKQLRQN